MPFSRDRRCQWREGRVDWSRFVQPLAPTIGVEEGDRLLDEPLDAMGACGVDKEAGGPVPHLVVHGPGLDLDHQRQRRDPGGEIDDGIGATRRRVHIVFVEQIDLDRPGADTIQPLPALICSGYRGDVVGGSH